MKGRKIVQAYRVPPAESLLDLDLHGIRRHAVRDGSDIDRALPPELSRDPHADLVKTGRIRLLTPVGNVAFHRPERYGSAAGVSQSGATQNQIKLAPFIRKVDRVRHATPLGFGAPAVPPHLEDFASGRRVQRTGPANES